MTLNFPDKHKFNEKSKCAHFLGSIFCESGPLRDVQKMALGCVMTTYKWETFDTLDEMVKSRVFSIFGNDCRLNR